MNNQQLKGIYVVVMGALLVGTFIFLMKNSPGTPTGYVAKSSETVVYPDSTYDVVSCVDDLMGNVKAGVRTKVTGEINYITFAKGRTTAVRFRCDGLQVIRSQ